MFWKLTGAADGYVRLASGQLRLGSSSMGGKKGEVRKKSRGSVACTNVKPKIYIRNKSKSVRSIQGISMTLNIFDNLLLLKFATLSFLWLFLHSENGGLAAASTRVLG